MKTFKAIFAGGGTGGHLFPALAIADRMKARLENEMTPEFIFVGTRRGIEYKLRESLGYPLVLINIRGVARSLKPSNLLFPFLLTGSVLKCLYTLWRFRPDIVVGTGGYVMGPVLLAAYLLNYPRVIQEQNSFPGVTTRRMAPLVDKVFLGFGEASRYLNERSTVLETGNPVKEIIGNVSREEALRFFGLNPDKKTILILGGSQGASRINKNILAHLDSLSPEMQLVWQTGEKDFRDIFAAAGRKTAERAVFSFTNQIEMAYAAADIAIARAGALTLAEIAAAGLASILIPYPYATGDHQTKNAESYILRGAAEVVADANLDQVNLLGRATDLVKCGQASRMAQAALAISRRGNRPATDIISEEIIKLARAAKE